MKPHFLEKIATLYGIDPAEMTAYPSHEGGRNKAYRAGDRVVRITNAKDRTYADLLAETEYVHYLAMGGADTVDVTPSAKGNLVEPTGDAFICVFTRAKGEQIADRGYRYLEGVPLSDYFRKTGKVLGKIHQLSKVYRPLHRRFDFFEKYNEDYFDALIPKEYAELKQALSHLLDKLRLLPKSQRNYGMVHFDFSDGNYNIDYDTGNITVFDFDNCRTCFYLFDLANLWTQGVGWIAHESNRDKRKAFMEDYFNIILEGYRSETALEDAELENLPLMIQAVLMENIIDEFEVQKAETGRFENNGEQAYRIACMVKGIAYLGFFDQMYDAKHPFAIPNE